MTNYSIPKKAFCQGFDRCGSKKRNPPSASEEVGCGLRRDAAALHEPGEVLEDADDGDDVGCVTALGELAGVGGHLAATRHVDVEPGDPGCRHRLEDELRRHGRATRAQPTRPFAESDGTDVVVLARLAEVRHAGVVEEGDVHAVADFEADPVGLPRHLAVRTPRGRHAEEEGALEPGEGGLVDAEVDAVVGSPLLRRVGQTLRESETPFRIGVAVADGLLQEPAVDRGAGDLHVGADVVADAEDDHGDVVRQVELADDVHLRDRLRRAAHVHVHGAAVGLEVVPARVVHDTLAHDHDTRSLGALRVVEVFEDDDVRRVLARVAALGDRQGEIEARGLHGLPVEDGDLHAVPRADRLRRLHEGGRGHDRRRRVHEVPGEVARATHDEAVFELVGHLGRGGHVDVRDRRADAARGLRPAEVAVRLEVVVGALSQVAGEVGALHGEAVDVQVGDTVLPRRADAVGETPTAVDDRIAVPLAVALPRRHLRAVGHDDALVGGEERRGLADRAVEAAARGEVRLRLEVARDDVHETLAAGSGEEGGRRAAARERTMCEYQETPREGLRLNRTNAKTESSRRLAHLTSSSLYSQYLCIKRERPLGIICHADQCLLTRRPRYSLTLCIAYE